MQPRIQHKKRERQQGFALLLSLIALAILAVLVTDLHETTGTGFSAAISARDQLRAEYLAKSGVNLTRMLVTQEKTIRQVVNPFYQMLLQRNAPQLPVWNFANIILEPFANFEGSRENIETLGFSTSMAKGLGETGGSFEIAAAAENGMFSVNDPRIQDVNMGRASVISPLYALMQGNISPSVYDPLFSGFDEKGRLTTRLDILSSIVDWWDTDEQRTSYDPVMGTTTASGAEDVDYYRTQIEPYNIKNAPFDTLEELRLVRGVGDDFWATFVEPDLDEPSARKVTIYGGGRLNPNAAPPDVLLARLCTFTEIRNQPLCADPTGFEQGKFITLVRMAKMMAPIPWFSRASDFVNFITGTGPLFDKLAALMPTMGAMLGPAGGMFTPLVLPAQPPDLKRRMQRMFTVTASAITIESTGRVGRARRLIRSVINFDDKWTPPPPNAARMPPLGIFSYYRID